MLSRARNASSQSYCYCSDTLLLRWREHLFTPISSLELVHMGSHNTSPSQLHTRFQSADVSFHCISNLLCTLLLHQGLQVSLRLIFSKADKDLNNEYKH